MVTSNDLYKNALGGVKCSCIYCCDGKPHAHGTERMVPILGSPHMVVCRNCGHKALVSTLPQNSTKENR